jgi:hypothetical protein
VIARDREKEEDKALALGIENNGYAIVPRVVTAEETRCSLPDLEQSTSSRTRAGVRHLLSNPAVARLATDQRMLGIAQSVLGRDAFPFKATLFDKSSEANWLITWHQDTALPLREKSKPLLGAHGPPKKAFFMRMLRPVRWRRL